MICVSLSTVTGEEALKEFQHLQVKAERPGKVTINFKHYNVPKGSVTITVLPKSKIALWPPLLQGAKVSPTNPGEVTLTWTDDPRTSPQITLGYVIERSDGPGKPFQSILGAGKMLPPAPPGGTASYVDVAEPNRQYEYRVIAVGDSTVTDRMPESEEKSP